MAASAERRQHTLTRRLVNEVPNRQVLSQRCRVIRLGTQITIPVAVGVPTNRLIEFSIVLTPVY